MIFRSRLPLPPVPQCDVFNYIFHHSRRNYPRDRVLYSVDGTDEQLTLAELEDQSRRLARTLHAQYDIKPQDVIAIFARDKIQYPIAYFGAMAAGATIALIPVQATSAVSDIARHLQQTNAKLLITDSDMLSVAEAASLLLNKQTLHFVTLDDAPTNECPSIAALLKMTANHCREHVFQLDSPEAVDAHTGFINRTSGSTGNMKCVLVSHAHFIATMEGTRATIPSNTSPDTDTWLSQLSLGFFINAKLNMGLNILLGIRVILVPSKPDLDAISTIDLIARHRITFLFVTPPLAAQLARTDPSPAQTESIKWLLSAGAPIHENMRAAVSRRFHDIPLSLELGTAETMLVSMQFDEDSCAPGSTGTLVSGNEAKVLDSITGLEQSGSGPEYSGEILVRNSVARYRGYQNDAKANEAAFDSDGWFHTGDFGYLDDKGNVFIVDRMKELIKAGGGYGVHVSAAELEAVLFTHEAVESVVVLGVRAEGKAGDLPTAFVVLKEKSCGQREMGEAKQGIVKFAEERLTGLQKLTGGVYCLPELPRTGFKVNRRALREMVQVHTACA
ncbi:hypothetical protein N7447_001738 [Penicillium robsamsonii]|uniref:uncharacterized protein n=1 Tax=Penicillium robsamsonii TaxID=1792511 RepID=UPI0025490FBD|nr:uncharacterized protein N7447_001738 [Penicillium robsamsonii]KAJ5835712.1 hypothetical protein N7447_001738 [Penicillium robsamsonii]